MKKTISFFMMALIFACATGTSRLIEEEKLNFNYTDDAYLFFRNMRQTNYSINNMQEKDLRLYTHDDYAEETPLKATIVVSWKANNAFAIMQLKDSVSNQDSQFYFQKNGEKKEIKFPNLRRQGELVVLTKLYNHLLQEDTLFVKRKVQKLEPLFIDQDSREAFRVSMYDFYRLTGVL